jgi:hypothetical protein
LRNIAGSDSIPNAADIEIIVEIKATHNLALPMTGIDVSNAYNDAYNNVYTLRGGRTTSWSNVCHPIGQLLGYMVENGRRYGALSSGTRTYFLYISGNGQGAQVHISDAWFIGQANFLRAWAYVHALGCQQEQTLTARELNWKKHALIDPRSNSKPIQEEGAEGEGGHNESGGVGGGVVADSAHRVFDLVETPITDVEIIGSLGYGKNGVVFLAVWNGKKIALKQFDVGKDGNESFDNEVEAYTKLKDAWGSLVATPLFVSESWGGWIKFLGLQLGRDPAPGDDISEWTNVLSSLEDDYGFRHDDADGGCNMIFITDEDSGRERLVAIDLERHTLIP